MVGIDGISQGITNKVVARCADQSLLGNEFIMLSIELSKDGYELVMQS